MHQRTIDLQKDLITMLPFGSLYFDGNAGEVGDIGGSENHGVASGGPSVSDTGPRQFGSVTLDGTDDYFDVGSGYEYNQFTYALLYKVVQPQNQSGIGGLFDAYTDTSKNRGAAYINWDGDDIVWYFEDPNYILGTDDIELAYDTWVFDIMRGDMDAVWIDYHRDGEKKGQASEPSQNLNPTYSTPLQFGRYRDDTELFEGEMAFAAAWGRTLSDAEVDYLSSIVSPPVGYV